LEPNRKAKVHAGRILVPHTRNNFEVWAVHSDDDGLTWSADQPVNGNVTVVSPDGPDCNRNMSYFGVEVSVGFERNTRTKSMESCLSTVVCHFLHLGPNRKNANSIEQWVQELGWSTPGGDPYKR
jgi:hypothetical protein